MPRMGEHLEEETEGLASKRCHISITLSLGPEQASSECYKVPDTL